MVLIINDGGLTDFDGNACCSPTLGCADDGCKDTYGFDPAYPDMLSKAQADLREEGVVVYGVVIRRFVEHDKRDEEAEKKLKTLVSDPRDDHYVNVLLDEVISGVLDTLCDPTSQFGKGLSEANNRSATGCGPRATSEECAKNPSCYWDDQQMPPCKDDVCFSLCSLTECEANALCAWDPRNGSSCGRKPPTCADKTTEAECKDDDTCLWNPVWHNGCTDNVCKNHTSEGACNGQDVTMPAPCVAPVDQPDYCQVEVCTYDPDTMSCEVKKCLNMDEAKCTAESGCFLGAVDQPAAARPAVDAGRVLRPRDLQGRGGLREGLAVPAGPGDDVQEEGVLPVRRDDVHGRPAVRLGHDDEPGALPGQGVHEARRLGHVQRRQHVHVE